MDREDPSSGLVMRVNIEYEYECNLDRVIMIIINSIQKKERTNWLLQTKYQTVNNHIHFGTYIIFP